MNFRLLFPMLAAFALPVQAEDIPCSLNGAEVCVPILACVGNQGLWFDGRAYGTRSGRIEGVMSDGTACTGSWELRGLLGVGRADLTCDDGRVGGVWYTYRDRRTGTAIGTGRSVQGEKIKAWAGDEVLAYLSGDGGTPQLPCIGGAVPLG